MELAFSSGASVFGPVAPNLSQPVPAAVERDDNRRRRPNDDNRNWLAGSLSLPSLGQSSSNAAALAMGVAEEDSSWGWLASDVANRAEDRQEDQNSMNSPAEPDSMTNTFGSLMGESDDSSIVPDDGEEAESGSADFPFGDDTRGGKRAANETGRSRAAVPGSAGRNLPADAGRSGMRSDSPADTLSGQLIQTRSLLSEITAQVRPTLSSLLQKYPGESASLPNSPSDQAVDRPALLDLAKSGITRSIGDGSVKISSPAGLKGLESQGGLWQGGWKAQIKPESLSSYHTTYSDSTSVQIPISSPPITPKPGFSSSAYKPGWY